MKLDNRIRAVNPWQLVATASLAALLAVSLGLAPRATRATGGSPVQIRDTDTLVEAEVDAGRLRVGDGAGPLTVDVANATGLAVRTPLGGKSFAAGTTANLGVITTRGYSEIRFFGNNRCVSPTNVTYRLTITEGSEWLGQLDTFTLAPCGQITKVYTVPARQITILAQAAGGAGTATVDMAVYGRP